MHARPHPHPLPTPTLRHPHPHPPSPSPSPSRRVRMHGRARHPAGRRVHALVARGAAAAAAAPEACPRARPRAPPAAASPLVSALGLYCRAGRAAVPAGRAVPPDERRARGRLRGPPARGRGGGRARAPTPRPRWRRERPDALDAAARTGRHLRPRGMRRYLRRARRGLGGVPRRSGTPRAPRRRPRRRPPPTAPRRARLPRQAPTGCEAEGARNRRAPLPSRA